MPLSSGAQVIRPMSRVRSLLPLTYRQALANRRFRLVTLGFGISSLGDGMSALAVAWLAIEISSPANRGLVVGAAVASYTLPGAIGIFLHRILGRLDSSPLVLLNCALRGACLGTIALLAYLGRLEIVSYVVLLAGSALLASWGTAARYALDAETLAERMRLGGNGLLGSLLNFGYIAGPAAALPDGCDRCGSGARAGRAELILAPCTKRIRRVGADPCVDWEHPKRATDDPPRPHPVRSPHPHARVLLLLWACRGCASHLRETQPSPVGGSPRRRLDLLRYRATTGGLAFGILRRASLFTTALLIIAGWEATLAVIPFADVPFGIAAFTLGGLIWAPYPTLVTTFLQQQASGRALTTLSSAWTSATMLATPLGTAVGGPLVAGAGAARALFISALATLAIVPVAAMTRRL